MNAELAEIFKTALLNEVEGQKFYELAATQAHSEDARNSLLELAAEEVIHQDYIKKEMAALEDEKLETTDYTQVKLPNPEIYKWGKVDKAELGLSMSVYKIGMQMEKDAVEFYTKCKDLVGGDPRLLTLFDTLVKWENQHYLQFSKLYEQFRNEYWSDQQFAPF